jgi:DNA repair protein RecN (Recombination protein N)
MLVEVGVQNLGVIESARIPFQEGLIALTGETGAGKTMVVEALDLLSGGRADPGRVRPGHDEAVVEGLFVVGETEWVLRRVVPANGRSRGYVNGELATMAALAELASSLMEVHGQHAQQGLLKPSTQRDALDRFAGIDRTRLRSARNLVRDLRSRLDELGGDDRQRSRELDLLRYQADEIAGVDPRDGETETLDREEDRLADAVGHRDAAIGATAALVGDVGAAGSVAASLHALSDRAPFSDLVERLRSIDAELHDIATEVRSRGEAIEPNEERLAEIRERRHALVELRRKYGDTLAEVLDYAAEIDQRIEELTSVDAARTRVGDELADALDQLDREARRLGAARRAAAPELANRVSELLAELALAGARVEIHLSDLEDLPGGADVVEIRLSTNAGMEVGPLSRIASGGELSRVMLALRLVLSGGPPTMVFDEVDAGIGGEAAVAVAEALARLGQTSQVLVVTHLPQVAAAADHQLLVSKAIDVEATSTTIEVLDRDARVVEVSRMLSGSPGSSTARRHAEELLGAAVRVRRR